MKVDPNYPRWMFHRYKQMVCVNNQDEEVALGPEWSRTQFPPASAALPKEEKPKKMPEPEEPEPEDEPEPEEEKPAPAPKPEPPILKPPYKEQPPHHTAPAAKRPPSGAIKPPVRKKAK